MPPILDIGPYPQYVQFVLSVTNHLGKTVTGICFNVTVMPVDNQPPQVKNNSSILSPLLHVDLRMYRKSLDIFYFRSSPTL